jgi:hypothetical protein
MTGCVEQRSRMRLHTSLTSRSAGRGQERRMPASAASELLTADRREGYLTQYSNRTPSDLTSLSDEVLSFTLQGTSSDRAIRKAGPQDFLVRAKTEACQGGTSR